MPLPKADWFLTGCQMGQDFLPQQHWYPATIHDHILFLVGLKISGLLKLEGWSPGSHLVLSHRYSCEKLACLKT